MKTEQFDYQKLEFMIDEKSTLNTQKSTLILRTVQFLKAIAIGLFSTHEPRIYQRKSRAGKAYWIAFDPITQQRTVFSSEQDLLIWIDQRYYC